MSTCTSNVTALPTHGTMLPAAPVAGSYTIPSPVIRSTAQSIVGNGTTASVAYPTGSVAPKQNDFILVLLTVFGGNNSQPTVPTGYTLLPGGSTAANGAAVMSAFWKQSQGQDTGDLDITLAGTEDWQINMYVIENVLGLPEWYWGTSTTLVTPSITTGAVPAIPRLQISNWAACGST
jgi:hypothetical protein